MHGNIGNAFPDGDCTTKPAPKRSLAAGSECARTSALYEDLGLYSGFLPQTPDCHSISIDFSYAPKKT